MPAPQFTLAVTGTDPKVTTREALTSEVNRVVGEVWDQSAEVSERIAIVQEDVSGGAKTGTGFSRGGRMPFAGAAIVDAEGRVRGSFDERANPRYNFGVAFSLGGVAPGAGLILLSEDGKIIADLGGGAGGGGDNLALLPDRQPVLGTGKKAWIDGSTVRVTEVPGDLYTLARASIFTDLATLYARYDALVAEFPDYITKTSLGQDALGNHIYQYAFLPPAPRLTAPATGAAWTAADIAPPKVILLSGVHGSERPSQMGNLIFAHNLCHAWRERPEYAALRWGARIYIIPAACPSGVNAGTRPNHNGVDINRNAAYRWGEAGDTEPGGDYYMGPSAASEPETQILQGLATLHPDACGLIDHHNHGETVALWFGSSGSSTVNLLREAADGVIAFAHTGLSGPTTDEAVQNTWVTKAVPGNIVGYLEMNGLPAGFAEEPASAANSFLDGTITSHRRLSEAVPLTLITKLVQRELRRRQLEA